MDPLKTGCFLTVAFVVLIAGAILGTIIFVAATQGYTP